MATFTGQQQLQVLSDIDTSDTFGTSRSITSASDAGSGLVQFTTSTNHGFAANEWVRLTGTTTYNGVWQVVGAPSLTTFRLRVPWVATTTGSAAERTAQGYELDTSGAMQLGNASAPKTNIVHDTDKSVVLEHQVTIYQNGDGTPVLAFGSQDFPTMVFLTWSGTDWGTGGPFRAGGSTRPVLKFNRCNVIYTPRVRQSAFAGNTMRLVLDANACNFSWLYPESVPFLGTNGIVRDCVFLGATNTLVTNDHSLFLALPRVFTGCTIRRWGVGLKLEYGSAFWGQVQFSDCDVEGFTSRNQNSAGFTAGDMNLVDSVFDKSKVFISYRASINAFRTTRLTAKLADGTAVSGVKLYSMDTAPSVPVERQYSLTCKASVQDPSTGESFYQGEDTTIGNITNAREIMHVFRPGEVVSVSGFSTAANNGTKNVTGKPFGGTRYADSRELFISEQSSLVAEATPPGNVTFTKLPPSTGATGETQDYLLHCFHAQAKDYGNNAVDAARNNVESVSAIESAMSTIQMGSGTLASRIESDAFIREDWRLVAIPAYPYARHSTDASLPINSGGARFDWSPLMANNANLTDTSAANIAAYTTVTNLDRLYDALEYHKSLEANHAFPRLDLSIADIDGDTLDFGSLNVTFDGSATALIRTVGTTVTIKCESDIAGTSRLKRIKTTGTISFVNSASVSFPYQDTNGATSRVTVTAGSSDSIALYSPDGTLRQSGTGSFSVALTAAQSQAGMKVVAMRPGYIPSVRSLDTSSAGAFAVSFDALKKDKQPDGTDSIGTLSANISVAYTVSDISDVEMRIDIGNAQVRARAAWTEASTASITADGLKYLAFGGTLPQAVLSPLGDSFFMPSSVKLRRAASGDSNSGILATVIQADDQPIDNTNGDVQLIGGVTLPDFAKAIAFDADIDTATMGTQSIASILLAAKTAAEAAQTRLGTDTLTVGARLSQLQSQHSDQTTTDTNRYNTLNTGVTLAATNSGAASTAAAAAKTAAEAASARLGTGGSNITDRIAAIGVDVTDVETRLGTGGDNITDRLAAIATSATSSSTKAASIESRIGSGGSTITQRLSDIQEEAEIAAGGIMGNTILEDVQNGGKRLTAQKVGSSTENVARATVLTNGNRTGSEKL